MEKDTKRKGCIVGCCLLLALILALVMAGAMFFGFMGVGLVSSAVMETVARPFIRDPNRLMINTAVRFDDRFEDVDYVRLENGREVHVTVERERTIRHEAAEWNNFFCGVVSADHDVNILRVRYFTPDARNNAGEAFASHDCR